VKEDQKNGFEIFKNIFEKRLPGECYIPEISLNDSC